MERTERRQTPRHDVEIGVTISTGNSRIEAKLIDIGGGGVGVIAEEAIVPGSDVRIAIAEISDYVVQGVVRWSYRYHEGEKTRYRMGIETESLVASNETETEPSKSSELISRLMAETKKNRQNPDSGGKRNRNESEAPDRPAPGGDRKDLQS